MKRKRLRGNCSVSNLDDFRTCTKVGDNENLFIVQNTLAERDREIARLRNSVRTLERDKQELQRVVRQLKGQLGALVCSI